MKHRDYGIGDTASNGGEIVAIGNGVAILAIHAPLVWERFEVWSVDSNGEIVAPSHLNPITALGVVDEFQCGVCDHSSTLHNGDNCEDCEAVFGEWPCKEELRGMTTNMRNRIQYAHR